jgi:predicted transcriptional regulator
MSKCGEQLAMPRKERAVVSTFRPHNEGLAKLFGPLEADILALLWQRGEASARDIFEDLRDAGQRLSYGAVKTVLDRLVVKQVLQRSQNANQYLYRAFQSQDEFAASAIDEIIDSLVDSFGAPVYARFLDRIQADPAQIERLTKLINDAEAKRK